MIACTALSAPGNRGISSSPMGCGARVSHKISPTVSNEQSVGGIAFISLSINVMGGVYESEDTDVKNKMQVHG